MISIVLMHRPAASCRVSAYDKLYPNAASGGELNPAEMLAIKVVNSLRLGGLLKATGIAEKMAVDSLGKTPFTQLANFTGQPAMSVPLYWSAEGLPCGSQFIGRFGDEATLYRLAAQLEKEQPWFDKRPPVAD
jgi:amidase